MANAPGGAPGRAAACAARAPGAHTPWVRVSECKVSVWTGVRGRATGCATVSAQPSLTAARSIAAVQRFRTAVQGQQGCCVAAQPCRVAAQPRSPGLPRSRAADS